MIKVLHSCTTKLVSKHDHVFLGLSVFNGNVNSGALQNILLPSYNHWKSCVQEIQSVKEGRIAIVTFKVTCQSSGKTSFLKSKLQLETVHKRNDPFHKLHRIRGRYFSCLPLPVQSRWRSRAARSCQSTSTVRAVLGALRWERNFGWAPDAFMFFLRGWQQPFCCAKTEFLTIFTQLKLQMQNLCSQPLVTKNAAARRYRFNVTT